MKTRSQQIEEIALTRIPLVGPVLGRQLIHSCGSAGAVFETPRRILKTIPGIGEEIAGQITQAIPALEMAEAELDLLERQNIRYTFFSDADYPSRLRQLPDAPLILYMKGRIDLQPERTVGIIGTRHASPKGKALTRDLVRDLAGFDV